MLPDGIAWFELTLAILIAWFGVMPLSVLAHELGHAAVALRVTSRPVTVVAGRTPSMISFRLGRLQVRWSAMPARGVGFGGLCIYRSETAGPASQLAVILGGLAISALLLFAFLAAMFATIDMPAWIPAVWGVSALFELIGLLAGGDPRPENEAERDGTEALTRDGPSALAHYRAWRGTGGD